MSYFDKFSARPKKSLVVWATHDLTFLPEFSRQIIDEFQRRQCDFRQAILPCGHYVTGETPFKYMDAFHICRFVGRAF